MSVCPSWFAIPHYTEAVVGASVDIMWGGSGDVATLPGLEALMMAITGICGAWEPLEIEGSCLAVFVR